MDMQDQSHANSKRPRVLSDRRLSPVSDADWTTTPAGFDYPRKRASVACEVCRLRKTRCDAKRPSCSFCSQSGATCEYRRTFLPSTRPVENAGIDATIANQSIIDRLTRIEDLLENLNRPASNKSPLFHGLDNNTDNNATPISSHIAAHSPLERRHNHPTSEPDLIVGHSLKGLSRIAGHTLPEPLIPLAQEDGEEYLKLEVRRGEELFSNRPAELQNLDLSPRTCWRLQQSFTRSILPWCPFIDQEECAQLVARTCELNFPEHDLETCMTLFILSLGAIVKGNYRGDTGSEFSGLGYFQVASRIIGHPRHTNYSIIAVQCRILMAFYYLFCLRMVQAFDTIHQASLAVLGLLQYKSRMEVDSRLRQQVYRAYWACYLTEHELQSIVSYSSCLLQSQNEFVPLPLFDHDEPGSYWFLSEIAFRKIFSNSRDGFGWNAFTLHKTAVAHEIILQLQQWYDYLPAQIKFPMTLAPLLDTHKVFLRAQYYAVVGVLQWSFVVRLLTAPAQTENEHNLFVESGAKCLEFCVMHVHAVESLMQERHLMLAANISGLHCIANLLLCTYNVPALASVQHPKQGEAIQKARNLLANWATNPVIASHISRLDAMMVDKGLKILSPEEVSFPSTISYSI